ncbi:TatD family hydrolase [Pseudomarimonas arenosa]|uniref:TatD family hydrolase n=1 Tax=Pseudomarimonas arenosa TaxID=2774145 RepID=A0AAW3ZP94_9GAMM|nr:TatD family hydrolase [Pseudomarimonas arenosa]
MRLFDSHCHFDVDEFAVDRDAALQRARTAGVGGQVVPAIDFASWPRIEALCAAHADLHPAYGLHPMYIAHHLPEHIEALDDWLQQHPAVAVGECGLDFLVEGLPAEPQRQCFEAHLEVAKRHALPLVIHARRAVEEVIHRLRAKGGLSGVVHSYSGSLEQAHQLFDLGFMIGLGGPVTYDRASKLRRIVKEIPLDCLLLETDAPDQPDASHRGERNEPSYLPRVAEVIAELRGISVEELAKATWNNATRLFFDA